MTAGGVHGTVDRQYRATSDEERSEAEQQAERGVGSRGAASSDVRRDHETRLRWG